MKVLDLFAGIGGFTKGLTQAGFEFQEHWFSEIDKHCIANYKYNFSNAEYIGSATDVRGSRIERPDIITFGSPCQDFSLAGNRNGLNGQKSVLILEAIRIIRECRPSVFIWENVKGAFSTNGGADFWGIIAAFADIGGYRLEWQLLNTSWFLPQNRERIYLIGHLAGRSEPGVFPIGENNGICARPNADSKEIHTDNRIALTQQARHFSSWNGDFIKVKQISASKESGNSQPYQQNRIYDTEVIAPALLSGMSSGTHAIIQKGRGKNKGGEHEICPTITKNSFEHNNHVSGIRRLTEIECERLQGFPDDWTKYGNYDGEVREISKTQRYKMCGNAVTVDVVECIGKRLLQ